MNSNNLEVPSDIVLLEKHNEPADFFMDSQDHTQDSDSLTVPEVTFLPSYNKDDEEHKHDETPIPSSQSNGGSENVSGSSGFFDSVSSQAVADTSFKMSFKSSAATVGKTNNTTRILKPKSVLGSPLKGKGRNESQLLLNYISLGSKTYVSLCFWMSMATPTMHTSLTLSTTSLCLRLQSGRPDLPMLLSLQQQL